MHESKRNLIGFVSRSVVFPAILPNILLATRARSLSAPPPRLRRARQHSVLLQAEMRYQSWYLLNLTRLEKKGVGRSKTRMDSFLHRSARVTIASIRVTPQFQRLYPSPEMPSSTLFCRTSTVMDYYMAGSCSTSATKPTTAKYWDTMM